MEQKETVDSYVEVNRENEPEQNKEELEHVFGPSNKPDGYEELDRSKPSQRKKYPNLKNKYADKKAYAKSDWPSKEECKTHVSR